MWHASIAKCGRVRTLTVDELRSGAIRIAERLAVELLEGVGGKLIGPFTSDPPDLAIHVQKRLTPAELFLLPAGWLDLPATDERGPILFLPGASRG